MTETEAQVYAYACNLMCFPAGYFQGKSAPELGISEEARQILIRRQAEQEAYRQNPAAREENRRRSGMKRSVRAAEPGNPSGTQR